MEIDYKWISKWTNIDCDAQHYKDLKSKPAVSISIAANPMRLPKQIAFAIPSK